MGRADGGVAAEPMQVHAWPEKRKEHGVRVREERTEGVRVGGTFRT